MELMSLSPPLTTPKDIMLEQFHIVAEEVMPHFRPSRRCATRRK